MVIMSGRLGRDPEMKYTAEGKAIAKFAIAVDRRRKDDPPDWIDVVAFDRLAELSNEYLTKGSKVTVIGRLQTRTWENKDGAKQRGFEVVASEVEFGPRADSRPSPSVPADNNEVPF